VADHADAPSPEAGPVVDGRPRTAGASGLARRAPLVPVDSAVARSLVAVIAIMTFLAALCGAAAEIAASSSTAWQSAVSREATIQLRPAAGRDMEADLAAAAALARRAPGVAEAQAFSQAESERLLEPWLGSGLDLGALPIPRLVVIKLHEGPRPDLADLRRALAETVPGATLDDHGLWLARLSTMAATVVGLGVALVGLVLAAAALAVAFATRGAVAGNRDIVDVLHVVGAGDDFIAREFQGRFFRLGLKGGGIGGAAALAGLAALGVASMSVRSTAAGDQLEALFGAFEISARGLGVVVLIAVAVALIAAGVCRITVRRFLAETRKDRPVEGG
jgi:cell division transport system permease protein